MIIFGKQIIWSRQVSVIAGDIDTDNGAGGLIITGFKRVRRIGDIDNMETKTSAIIHIIIDYF